jgi:hypothetical protein
MGTGGGYVPMTVEPVRLFGLYDDEKRAKQAGSVFDKNGISPTLTTMEGGNRQPLVVDRVLSVGNVNP